MKMILAVILIVSIRSIPCFANHQISNLVSESVEIAFQSDHLLSHHSYDYTFSRKFDSVPSVAVAVHDFSFKLTSPLSFSITPASSQQAVVFVLQFNATIWTKIKLSFMASLNSQIQLGWIEVSKPEIKDNLKIQNNVIFAYVNLIHQIYKNLDPVTTTFIHGYDLRTDKLSLKVGPEQIKEQRLAIRIQFGEQTEITRIWVSYAIVYRRSDQINMILGTYSKDNFLGHSTVSIKDHSTPFKKSNMIYGVSEITISKNFISFESSISELFELSVSSLRKINSFTLEYLLLEVHPQKLCSHCENKKLAIFGNSCLEQCPQDTLKITGKSGTTFCESLPLEGKDIDENPIHARILTSTVLTNSYSQANKVVLPVSISTPINTPCPLNAFFNGNQCICHVGYVYQNGICLFLSTSNVIFNISLPTSIMRNGCCNDSITIIPPPAILNTTCGGNQVWNITNCICIQGYLNISGVCTIPIIVCPSPLVNINGICVKGQVDCSGNTVNNGLGSCICKPGYFQTITGCVQEAPCPLNSIRQLNGSCTCNTGYTNYSNLCSQCPPGAYWSSASNQCIFVCGTDSFYNNQIKSCICNAGYGLMGSACQICPLNYFIMNGYCVTCPLNSKYNPSSLACECQTGYFVDKNGACTFKCGTNQIYDNASRACGCISGLGRVNGICQICPLNTLSVNQLCSQCQTNEMLVNGNCVCAQGYAYNSVHVCTSCLVLNGFMINGFCSVCPNNLVYDGISSCICGPGKILQNSICVSQCQSDELLDSQGNCYTCGSNQVISNGRCVCSFGYALSGCGICKLSCGSNQFQFGGSCATCPLNTAFNPVINGCTCPTGTYMDNYGICQTLVLNPISCPNGQYFNATSGCLPCSPQCKTCTSSTQCSSCSSVGYAVNSLGQCAATCGNGLIAGTETCDLGSGYSLGCINCQIQPGYICSGQPSVCSLISQNPVSSNNNTTPVPNPPNLINTTSSSLYQSGLSTINSNNVFITLITNPTFTFTNPTEMQAFLKATLSVGAPTVYCAQRNSPNLNTFDCLLIFPSGVPNRNFTINFSYNYQGKTGNTTVLVNPLAASNSKSNSRSL